MNAYEIIKEDRKKLVDQIIDMMKQGTFGNAEVWNSEAMRPQNPLTNVKYRGGNRMRLMAAVVARGFTDPRWATHRQLAAAGYHINSGEHGIICEKWIYDRVYVGADCRIVKFDRQGQRGLAFNPSVVVLK